MAKYEIIPVPGEDVELLPGDEVWLTYNLLQGGDWFIGWQVGKIEQQLEADGRFLLQAYDPTSQPGKITFKCVVNPHPPAKVQLAGGFWWGVVAGIITTAAFALIYENTMQVRIFRELLEEARPYVPETMQETIDRTLENADTGIGAGIANAGKDLAGAFGLVAVAFIVYLLWE